MKLKTKLIISFVIITILPAVLTGFAVWGVANYHIKAIERTYGISGEEYRDFKQSIGTLNQIPEVHEFLSTMIIGVILILALTAMLMILWIYGSLSAAMASWSAPRESGPSGSRERVPGTSQSQK